MKILIYDDYDSHKNDQDINFGYCILVIKSILKKNEELIIRINCVLFFLNYAAVHRIKRSQ